MSRKPTMTLADIANQLAMDTHAAWAQHLHLEPGAAGIRAHVFTNLLDHILQTRKAALGPDRLRVIFSRSLGEVNRFLAEFATSLAMRHGATVTRDQAVEFFGVFHANRAWMRYMDLLGSGEVEPGIPDPMSDAFPTTAICDPYRASSNG